MEEYLIVLVTAPTEGVASGIARALVDERLAACVSIIPAVRSIYRWRGEICDEGEALCIIKTRADRFELLKQRVVSLHPYEVPEVISLPIRAGHEPYLGWISSSLAET